MDSKGSFSELGLKTIFLDVHQDNSAAFAVYCNVGFKKLRQQGLFVNMALTKGNYYTAKARSSAQQTSR